MILTGILEHVAAMAAPETWAMGSKEQPGGMRKWNDQLADRDSE